MSGRNTHREAAAKRFSNAAAAPRWSNLYDADTERLEDANFRRRRDVAVEIVREVLPPSGKVLDVGCGAAPVLLELRRLGVPCAGLEYSLDMLAYARKRLRAQGLADQGLFRGDCRALPFFDGTFDVVVCLGVISYVEDYTEVLKEIRRVLKPGGHALVSFRNRFNPVLWDPVRFAKRAVAHAVGRARPQPYTIGRLMDHRDVQARMAEQGFEVRAHYGIGYGPIRLNGRPLFAEATSMRISRALARLFARTGGDVAARWLADVSLGVYRLKATPPGAAGR